MIPFTDEQTKKVLALAPQLVADGKLPNLYFVTVTTNYQTDKAAPGSGVYNWADESYPEMEKFETKGGTVAVFRKFLDAVGFLHDIEIFSPDRIFDEIHTAYIEDRFSGTIYELGYVETWSKPGARWPSVTWELCVNDDSEWSKQNMSAVGAEFK